MADPHAIVALYRLTLNYTVSGLAHKHRVYAGDGAIVGGALQLNNRLGEDAVLLASDCAETYAALFGLIHWTDYTQGQCLWEQRSGTVWFPVESATPPDIVGSGTRLYFANQTTMVLYDTSLNRFKIVSMEGNMAVPTHSTNPHFGDSNTANFMDAWTTDRGVGHEFDPYNWATSKYGLYPKTNGFVSETSTFNRKLRRARGLA